MVDPDNGRELYLKDFMKVKSEITTAGAGPGGAGAFGYDVPLGAPRKRSLKTSAPYDQPVNESFIQDLDEAKKQAMESSKQGAAKYVNLHGADNYTISDHYDHQTTVATYLGGEQQRNANLNENEGRPAKKPRPYPHKNPTDAEMASKKSNKPRPFPRPNPVDEEREDKEISLKTTHGADLFEAIIENAGLQGMYDDEVSALFDFMEAITVFRHDYNENHPFLHYLGYLQRVNDFKPSPMLSYESLDELGKMIYDELAANEENYKHQQWSGMKMNESQKKFEDTPYARRLRQNRRQTNLRIIPEGKDGDGFWTVVPQSTLDAYKKNHIMGAPGAEGVEVNSKEEEEYNSGGVQKFPGGKSVKKKKTNESRDVDVHSAESMRNRQHHWTKMYLKKADSPVVVYEDADNKLLTVLEDANPENPMVQEQGYTTMDTAQALELLENGGYHGILLGYHRLQQESVDPSVRKRYKQTTPRTQTERNERWKRLATHTDGETIRLAESVTPDVEPEAEPARPLTESVEGLQQLSRDNGLEEGEVIDGKHVIEIEKPNCLAPVYYKVFKEDYENDKRAFIWDFNTGTLVNNPGFKVAK